MLDDPIRRLLSTSAGRVRRAAGALALASLCQWAAAAETITPGRGPGLVGVETPAGVVLSETGGRGPGYGDGRRGPTLAPAGTTHGRFEVAAAFAAPPNAGPGAGPERREEWPTAGLTPENAAVLLAGAGVTLLLFLIGRRGAGRRGFRARRRSRLRERSGRALNLRAPGRTAPTAYHLRECRRPRARSPRRRDD